MTPEAAPAPLREKEDGATGKWYPADMSDLHVGHVMHDLCKINSYYRTSRASPLHV